MFPSCGHVTLMVPNLAYIYTVVSPFWNKNAKCKGPMTAFCLVLINNLFESTKILCHPSV